MAEWEELSKKDEEPLHPKTFSAAHKQHRRSTLQRELKTSMEYDRIMICDFPYEDIIETTVRSEIKVQTSTHL